MYAEPMRIRSYIRIAAKSHPSSYFLRPSNFFSFSLAHATKLLFDVKQTRRLSLCPLSLSFFLCLLFTAHTIIAFVPLRSSVVLNFHISAMKRKKSRRKRRSAYLSIPRHSSNVVPAASNEKRTLAKKGPARSRVFQRAINWSAPPFGTMAVTGVSAVCASIPLLPGLASTNLEWRERRATGWRTLGRTDIN